jgi:hypothetical protein
LEDLLKQQVLKTAKLTNFNLIFQKYLEPNV